MLLNIARTLFITGLVAQSIACDDMVTGFIYTSDQNTDHDKLSMNALDRGGVVTLDRFQNLSAWSFLPGDGSSTITQETSFGLSIIYIGVEVRADNTHDPFAIVLSNLTTATFNLSLTAKGTDNQCELVPKIKNGKAGIELDLHSQEGRIREAFGAPEVLTDLKRVVWESLASAFPVVLADMVDKVLPHKVHTKALCKDILAATSEHFPKPDLNK